MVELYCELILARANVLDQLAFGERGNLARSRGKEEWKRWQGIGAGKGKPERGLWGLGGRTSTSTSTEKKEEREGEDGEYIDPALDEAAVSIFYAWSRFPHDVRELSILRTLLAERWGKEFMSLAQENRVEGVPVPERLAKGLRVKPPGKELVDCYLREIAAAYGVQWPKEKDLAEAPGGFDKGEEEGGEEGGRDDTDTGKGNDERGDGPSTPRRKSADELDLNKVTTPRNRNLEEGRSPVSVAPPAPRSDNPNPRVKLPDSDEQDVGPGARKGSEPGQTGGIPEVDELTKRFAALRR